MWWSVHYTEKWRTVSLHNEDETELLGDNNVDVSHELSKYLFLFGFGFAEGLFDILCSLHVFLYFVFDGTHHFLVLFVFETRHEILDALCVE